MKYHLQMTNTEKPIVIYGLGSFAEYIAYVISEDTSRKLAGYTVESEYLPSNVLLIGELPVVSFDKIDNEFPPENFDLFIAVGNIKVRKRIFEEAKLKGYNLYSYISTKAIVWSNLEYGENVFVSEDSGIQPFTKIGDNCILIGPRIGHHCVLGNHILMSCCYLAGNVSVDDSVFIGLNTTIKQNVKIASNNIIGMGCSIVMDTKEGEVYTSSKNTIKRTVHQAKIEQKYLK